MNRETRLVICTISIITDVAADLTQQISSLNYADYIASENCMTSKIRCDVKIKEIRQKDGLLAT